MEQEISIKVDSDLYQDFLMATDLSNETQEEAFDYCMKQYVSQAFSVMSQKYNSSKKVYRPYNPDEEQNDFYGKANAKIPKWARKPEQFNHKIIKAYFKAEEISGEDEITLSQLEQISCELGLSEKQFRTNYAQMKSDGPQTHGKVFEDNGRYVWIWEAVKDTLLEYKEYFYN